MSERTSRKIPVTERQFLWVQDDDKGEVTLHVGPTMVSPTAADRVVVDDGEGGFREDVSGRPQQMVELSDSQYAVLFNPLLESDGGPNGKFRAGRNESRPLRNGTRAMIPGPCSFYLRPGQRVDVRDAHELASNQYLVVKVYGEVDTTAPYFQVTARSATITRATAESPIAPGSTSPEGEARDVVLKRGQLIVIRGLDTQFFIPPTGVDIVPDTSVDESGATLNALAAQRLLGALPTLDPASASPRMEAIYDEDLAALEEPEGAAGRSPRRGVAVVDQSTRTRQRARPAALASARLRAEVERQRQELSEQASTREATLRDLARRLAHESAVAEMKNEEALEAERQTLADGREAAALAARLAREADEKAAERAHALELARVRAAVKRAVDGADVEIQQQLQALEVLVIQTRSAATVAERQAVQAGLVEALTALGDKALLSEVAHNMNLVSLFKGKDVGTILAEVLGGTPALPAVQALRAKFSAAGNAAAGEGAAQ